MRFKLLLSFEIKNTLKKIPHIILGAVALIAIISAIAFCGAKYLYNYDIDVNINIALVTEDDSKLMSTITSMVTQADSVKEYATFIPCTRNELPELLENGGVYAGIILQENAAKDIINGTNTPIEIVFPKNSGFESALISEIASAAASMLSTAQSGIYTLIDYYNSHYKYDEKSEMLDRINLTYITMVLFRANSFNEHILSATGNLSLIMYYVISAIVMLIMFYSINIATIYSGYSLHLSHRLINNDVGIFKQLLIKYLSILCAYGFMFVVLMPIIFFFFNIKTALMLILPILLSIMCISALTLLIYELFPKATTSILFIFLFSVFTAFVSGCFIPTLMLPDIIKNISAFLPIKHIINMLTGIITGTSVIYSCMIIILFIIIYFSLAVLIKAFRLKRSVE